MDLSVPERLYISSMVTIVVLPCKYKSFHPAKEKYHEKHTYFSFPAAPVVALRASQQPSQPAGRHPPDVVHVRTDVVVESDNPAYGHFRLADRCRTLHPVEPFLLYYAVHPLGHGVVRRVVVLGHVSNSKLKLTCHKLSPMAAHCRQGQSFYFSLLNYFFL